VRVVSAILFAAWLENVPAFVCSRRGIFLVAQHEHAAEFPKLIVIPSNQMERTA
jgi:hypothetical protein